VRTFPLIRLREKLFGNTFTKSKSGSAYKKILGFKVRLSDHYVSKIGGGSTNRGDIEIVLNPDKTFGISLNNREVDDLLYDWLEKESDDTQELDESGVLKMFNYLKTKTKNNMANKHLGIYAKGGKMASGSKYYVMDAKNGEIVSKGFNSEEQAKVEMYKLFEKTSNKFLTTKKMAKGGKTMKTKSTDNDYDTRWAIQEKEIERVRIEFSKNEPNSEFQKYIQKYIQQTLLGFARDGVFSGVKDDRLDLTIKSLFYHCRKIGEEGIYYATQKMENYSKEVQKERTTIFGKGGSILSSNYSIGGL